MESSECRVGKEAAEQAVGIGKIPRHWSCQHMAVPPQNSGCRRFFWGDQ